MKTTITFIFVFACLLSAGQKRPVRDDIYFQPEKKTVFSDIAKQAGSQVSEMDWLRQNLAQYHKQRKITFALGIASATLLTVGALTEDANITTGFAIAGGVVSLGGLYSYLKAETYLKKASLPPNLPQP